MSIIDTTRHPNPAVRAALYVLGVSVAVGIAAIVLALALSIGTRIGHLHSSTSAVTHAATAEREALDTRLNLTSGLLTSGSTAGGEPPARLVESLSAEAKTWADFTSALEFAGMSDLAVPLAQARAAVETAFTSLVAKPSSGGVVTPVPNDEFTSAIEHLEEESDLLGKRLDEMSVRELDELANRSSQLRATLLLLLVGCALTGVVICVRARQRALARRLVAERDGEVARSSAFGARLQRGLEMTRDEDEVFALMAEAIAQAAPAVGAEVLVADSSRAHFRRLHVTNEAAECGVVSPNECPAATSGRTEVFDDGAALDVCPRLRGRADCAVCIPLSVAGRTTGVIHINSSKAMAPHPSAINDLEVVARRTSERLAMVRAFESTSIEANTDALTGLANRRALQHQLRLIENQGQRYSLAFGDLDFFKLLNDKHGHDVGDRALRAFSLVLTETVRPDDLVARYGGEEFVLVFPECGLDQAESILERIRTRLAELLLTGSIPAFTVSFGLAASASGGTFDDVIAAADRALLTAKVNGRNRVLRASDIDISAQAAALSSVAPEAVLELR